ncbi:insulin-like growth factor binding protein [Anaeramoeba flamelloides]|uniref:Insulin-like growth factor binding protein n=1 Tax=Anaeramoeba flamelloides TaxID=1746091 RepID=A0ABQ8Z7V0_9EUKA|nr:insulin-like growth factor binding protein [Anaeramoeba flamelloides]
MKKLIYFLFAFCFFFPVSKSNEILECQSKKAVKSGSEFCINDNNTEGNQEYGSIAPIGASNTKFLVTWQSLDQDSDGYGIFAQIYNSEDGTKNGDEFQVNNFSENDQESPAITSIGEYYDYFVITWQSFDQDSDGYGIFAQLFKSKDGSKSGEEFQVNSHTESTQEFPAITSIGQNGVRFVVTWQGFDQDSSGYNIYAQLFKSEDGSKIGDEFQVNSNSISTQEFPAISSIGQDKEKFVVTWQSLDQDSSGYNIFARLFDSGDGSKIGEEFQVNNYTEYDQESPAITSIGSSKEKFVVTWQGYDQDSDGYGIFAQLFKTEDCSKIGEEFQVNNYTENDQKSPDITSIYSENVEKFVITWASNNQDGSVYGIFAQLFDSENGSKIGEEFQVNKEWMGDQNYPAITSIASGNNEEGKFIIAWTSFDQDENNNDLFAQIYSSDLICDCEQGYYSNFTNSNNCFPCSKGQYQNQTGQTQCLTCPSGSYQNEKGQSECIECATGTFNPDSGSTSIDNCIQCGEGQYQDQQGQSECLICLAGSYQNETGQIGCYQCSEGEYQDQNGQTQCFNCRPGSYQNETGQSECLKCTYGTFNPDYGSISIDNCTLCGHGEYQSKNGQSKCLNCQPGSYQNETGQSVCLKCTYGTYNPDSGSISIDNCIQCGEGQYQDHQGETECLNCQPGSYQNEKGQSQCKNCSTGTYNQEEGSETLDDCLKCPLGEYNDKEAQSSCSPCQMGQYSNQKGSTNCTDCVSGYYNSDERQTTCQFCQAGTYQNAKGAINCKSCPFNTWQANTGSEECEYCPLWSETLSIKTSSINQCYCKIGYYGEPGEYCSECPAEGICDTFNQHHPIPKSGFWSSNDNPNTLIECQISEACPGLGIEICNNSLGYTGYQCTECLNGFYKVDYKCAECPVNANFRLFLIFVVFMLLILFLLYIAKKATAYFGSFTISFSFLQFLAIVYQLNVDWPTNLSNTLQLFSPFDFNLDNLATECSFNFSYSEKWYIAQLFPFVCLFLFIITYWCFFLHSKIIQRLKINDFLYKKCPKLLYKPSKRVDQKLIYYLHLIKYNLLSPFFQSLSKNELVKLKNIFINFYLTLLTLLYLILSSKCLEIFDCKYDSKSKKSIFQLETQYTCFGDDQEWNNLLIFSIIFIILYIVGIPILILYLLIKNSKIMNEKQFDLRFGLLCSRYSKSFFYWEVVIMLRKLFLAILKTFFINSTFIQLILLVCLMTISLLLQFKYHPYLTNRHNFLESIQLIISIIILFSGLIFNSNELYNNASFQKKLFVTVIVSIIIIGVFLLFLITLVDIQHRFKANRRNNKFDLNSQKQKKIIQILLKNNQKINTLSLLFNWLITLNNKNSKKIFYLFNKIYIQINRGDDDVDVSGSGSGVGGGKDHQIKIEIQNYKNNKKMMKLNNSRLKNINLFQELFNSHILILFLRWYNIQANAIQKIRIKNLLQFFFQYKYIEPWREQKQEYLKKNRKHLKIVTLFSKKK